MLSRLFQMVYLLMEQDHITAEELAKRMEVSQRTIYRDLDKLSAAGIPVYTNRGRSGGISLLSDFVLDKTVLTAVEREQILESLQALAAVGYQEESEALEKLQSFFGGETQDWIEVDFSNWNEDDKQRDYFEQFKIAILRHRYLEINYSGMNQSITKRQVKPLKLCFRGQAWYLYGYCELRKDYRYFKLKRILDYELLETTFAQEQVGRLMGNNITKEEQQSPPMQVVLRINKAIAFRAYEELPNLTPLEDGSFRTELQIKDTGWLIEYLLSFGSYAEVIEPESLRTEMAELVKRMAKIYDIE